MSTAPLDVAIAVVVNGDRVLLAKRCAHRDHANLWEFPGGKVEVDETPRDAVIRECAEEIAINIQNPLPWLSIPHHYPNRFVHLHVFYITQFSGEAKGHEGQIIRWVPIEELPSYDRLQANDIIVTELCTR